MRSEDSASPFRELCISLDSPGPSLLSHHVKAYIVTLVKMEQMECSAVCVGVWSSHNHKKHDHLMLLGLLLPFGNSYQILGTPSSSYI